MVPRYATSFSHDIIIAGAGLSGLTLAVELAQNPFFENKKILLLDRDAKVANDRTWCFWATETEQQHLPPVISYQWANCRVFGSRADEPLGISPYQYCMVRGADFYTWARAQLTGTSNVEWKQAEIQAIHAEKGVVSTSIGSFSAPVVFNSALLSKPLLPDASALYPAPPLTPPAAARRSSRHTWFLQHFKGWWIETPTSFFNIEDATLMDFRIPQAGNTRFVYVLPVSDTRALVEFTVFSPQLLEAAEYEAVLKDYISRFLGLNDFRVVDEEFGVIPMTDYPLRPAAGGRLVNIGTAGGFVKGSSGYAFKRTQRRIRAFVQQWAATGRMSVTPLKTPLRFRVYDSILLRVLRDGSFPGKQIFIQLFDQLPASTVLRFLDEDTTLAEDWRVLNTPPKRPFLRAAFQQMPYWLNL